MTAIIGPDDKPKEVSISTTTLTIKTLVIGQRQFTIAMLKQLPEGLYHPFANNIFTARVWGHVLYPLGENGFHVIFEENGRLKRDSCVSDILFFRELRDGFPGFREDKYCDDVRACWDAVQNSPQLFIAV